MPAPAPSPLSSTKLPGAELPGADETYAGVAVPVHVMPVQVAKQGHPIGLYYLSVIEACERFGFFLMLALFTMYLNESLKMTPAAAFDIYGWYVSSVYFTPLIGGWLGGRGLSRVSWVLLGSLALGLGYAALLFGSQGLVPALVILAVGNGLFKPNIATLVGNLYAPGDSRRDEAFSIFYVSVNVGAMLGPVAGETVRAYYGFAGAFTAAGLALLLSALALVAFRGYIHREVASSQHAVEEQHHASRSRRVVALLVVGLLVVPFWMAYFQTGSTLTFFARDDVNRWISIGSRHLEIPAGYFAATGGFFVLLLTAPLALVLRRLRRVGLLRTSADKIVAGLLVAALAYGGLSLIVTTGSGKSSMLWLLGFYMVLTVSELLLSPIGLSMVTKLAPPRWVGALMGAWFLATAAGNRLSGRVGYLWTEWTHARFFAGLAFALLGTSLVMALQLGWLRRTLPREEH